MTSRIPRQSFTERRARKLPGPPFHPSFYAAPGGFNQPEATFQMPRPV
jgi:hypothetical protein